MLTGNNNPARETPTEHTLREIFQVFAILLAVILTGWSIEFFGRGTPWNEYTGFANHHS